MRTIAVTAVALVVFCGRIAAAQWDNSLKPQGELAAELTLASGGVAQYSLILRAQPTTQEQACISRMKVIEFWDERLQT